MWSVTVVTYKVGIQVDCDRSYEVDNCVFLRVVTFWVDIDDELFIVGDLVGR